MAFVFAKIYNSVVNKDHPFLPYETIDDANRADLTKLVNNLAVDSFSELMSHSIEDVTLGKKIVQIHPFSTWEYFLNSPELIRQLIQVNQKIGWGFDFLKTQSLVGFALAFQERHERRSEKYPQGELFPFLKQFSKRIRMPFEELQVFVEKEDWNGFISRLLPSE